MWKNLLLVPASMVVFFIIFEATARIWISTPNPYPAKPGLMVQDTRGFWVIEPEYSGLFDNRVDFQAKKLTTTKYGTRTVPCAPVEPTTGNRVFLVGDSQTFGFGLADEETWANLLQCRLNDWRGGWKVHNLGVPGINIDQYYVRTAGMLSNIVRPGDRVIVSVTWNDLHTHLSSGLVRMLLKVGRFSELSGAKGLNLDLVKPLRRYLGPTWRYRLYQRTGIFVPALNSVNDFINSMPYASALLGIVLPKARLLYYRFRDPATLPKKVGPETIQNNFKILSAISTLIKRRGGRLIINLLPNRLFFDDFYYWSYSQGKQGLPTQDYVMYLAKPHCRRLGLECITSFPALKTARRDEHTFSFDGHYNEAGALRIADFLYQYQGLVRAFFRDGLRGGFHHRRLLAPAHHGRSGRRHSCLGADRRRLVRGYRPDHAAAAGATEQAVVPLR
jgi:hypothetical protein